MGQQSLLQPVLDDHRLPRMAVAEPITTGEQRARVVREGEGGSADAGSYERFLTQDEGLTRLASHCP